MLHTLARVSWTLCRTRRSAPTLPEPAEWSQCRHVECPNVPQVSKRATSTLVGFTDRERLLGARVALQCALQMHFVRRAVVLRLAVTPRGDAALAQIRSNAKNTCRGFKHLRATQTERERERERERGRERKRESGREGEGGRDGERERERKKGRKKERRKERKKKTPEEIKKERDEREHGSSTPVGMPRDTSLLPPGVCSLPRDG